jgi:DNA-binding beta-propeller fold protein YncE
VGGLAYWLAQQGVRRGNQPQFYYFLIGPLYEYLALAFSAGGGVAALIAAVRDRPWRREGTTSEDVEMPPVLDWQRLFPIFLTGWTVMSWGAYTYAGEKMPWLLVHIALPSIFLAGWALGRLLARISSNEASNETSFEAWARPGWTLVIALPLTVIALALFVGAAGDLRAALSAGVSTAGLSLAQLQPLGRAAGGLLSFVAFGYLLVRALDRLGWLTGVRLAVVVVAAVMAGLTVRTMVMVNYINYDMATELLVYAHGTPDIKTALAQIDEVSWRVTGTPHDVKVAYGEDGSWPFTWYMVDYPNNYFYSTTPDATQLLACPVIIAGSPQYGVVDEIVGADYVTFEYTYLWWPLQDYFDLTWARVRNALADPGMRAALWDIIWRRDYRRYAEIKNPDSPFTLDSWPYRKDFRLYVRREIAAEVWPYDRVAGAARYVEPVATDVPDPYAAGAQAGTRRGEVVIPGAVVRGLAQAADGTFYVADTANHRILHVDKDGVIGTFGAYGVEPGQFSEPWDVALDEAGHIYVADTWNHRIQKFSPSHDPITSWGMWGQITQIGEPGGQGLFYGPRSLAVSGGELYVTDTGNKRVQVFDLEGAFLREFGGTGSGPGQLDEPVGVAVSAEGRVAVADTWNRRVQVFDRQGTPLRQWQIPTWDIISPEEKPFLAWGGEQLYVTDPLRRRVLAFDEGGAFRWALSAQAGADFLLPQAVLVDDDLLYVTDAHSGRLLSYELP